MKTLEMLLSIFGRPKRKAPDKVEPQRTADVLPKRREITPKRAARIQRLHEIRDRRT